MLIYTMVLIIYVSFLLDFLVWPVPSEASTFSIINSDISINFIYKILLVLVFAANLVFYLIPLALSIYYLFLGSIPANIQIAILGILISILGRVISLKSAIQLRESGSGIVCNSLFKYSRNPISLGLHVSIAGLLIIFGNWYLWLFFTIYLLNIHYKIKIEENELYKKYGLIYDTYKKNTPRYLIKI